MKASSEIKFITPKVQESFYKLQKGDDQQRRLFKAMDYALDRLEENAYAGIRIQKKLIPKEYDVKNLWKYNLPDDWRLLYTIKNNEAIIISIILEWLPHKEYERRFGY